MAGLGALFALISVINAVGAGTAARKKEFALARLSGMSRGQVVAATVLEAALVAVLGLLLGAGVVAICLSGLRSGLAAELGTGLVDVPWFATGVLAAAGLVVAATTAAVGAALATRPSPIGLLSTGE